MLCTIYFTILCWYVRIIFLVNVNWCVYVVYRLLYHYHHSNNNYHILARRQLNLVMHVLCKIHFSHRVHYIMQVRKDLNNDYIQPATAAITRDDKTNCGKLSSLIPAPYIEEESELFESLHCVDIQLNLFTFYSIDFSLTLLNFKITTIIFQKFVNYTFSCTIFCDSSQEKKTLIVN